MSLYHHVANKEALLDGMVDVVVGEMNAERRRGGGADGRSATGPRPCGPGSSPPGRMLRHVAPAVLESRTREWAVIAYDEGVLATLRVGGFSTTSPTTRCTRWAAGLGLSQESSTRPGGVDARCRRSR